MTVEHVTLVAHNLYAVVEHYVHILRAVAIEHAEGVWRRYSTANEKLANKIITHLFA